MVTEKIGIIGTGRMGTAFATRLIELGHSVTVWNRTPEKASKAVEAGAARADSLADLLGASDILISSLTNQAAIASVLESPGGLLDVGIYGMLWIEMSTLLPDAQKGFEATATAAGCDYLECPVGGTVGPALKGALLGMAGGTEQAWSRALPILEGLCKRVEHMGPVGTGSAMKLAVNLPLALYWATMGEALNIVKDQGVPLGTAASVMSDSSGGPAVLKNRLEVVVSTLEGKDQPGTFDIDGLRKDLQLALEWAARRDAPMPLSGAAAKLYETAVNAGLGGYDGSSLTRLIVGD